MAIDDEWWRNKLAEDMYATLKLKEQTIPAYRSQSPQLWIRRHLVDWMSVIVSELGICATAQHLAIYLLDKFMDGLEVELCYIHLVALTCLLIAIKFEDHCDNIPQYVKLNSYLPPNNYNQGRPYTAQEFLQMELNLLKFTSFELCIPTVAHFLPYFLQVGVDEDDLRDGLPITSKAVVQTYLDKHACYFQEICLQDHEFRDYSPSLISAACVAGARICLHLTPTWPKQLELMTDYYLEQLLPCLHIMLGTHHQDSLNTALANYTSLPDHHGITQHPSVINTSYTSTASIQNTYLPSSVMRNSAQTGNKSCPSLSQNKSYVPCVKNNYVPVIANTNTHNIPLTSLPVNRSYLPANYTTINNSYNATLGVNSGGNNSYVPSVDISGSYAPYHHSASTISSKQTILCEQSSTLTSVFTYPNQALQIGVGTQLYPRARES